MSGTLRVLVLALLAVAPGFGCDCDILLVDDVLNRPVLFIGEVIEGGIASIREDPWYSPRTRVRFRVLERFRGIPAEAKTVDVEINPPDGWCSPNPYYAGKRYLVLPHLFEGRLKDGRCFTGRDVERSRSLVNDVRLHFAGLLLPVTIRGRVAVAHSNAAVRSLLDQGMAKPLAGVQISATGSGKTFSATTDSEGRYAIVAPIGTYRLEASLPPYTFADDIRVSAMGVVAERDIAARFDTSICGHVWDEHGQPVKSANVGLIDLELKYAGSRGDAFVETFTDESGSYCFNQPAPGRYLVVFNPETPGSRPKFDPRERTYYPRDSPRAKAEPVVIETVGTHRGAVDLVAGAPLSLRDVTIRVTFPDGEPMNHAFVRCVADPDWKDALAALEKGEVRFRAPVDRKLRITVEEWYGRDLKAKYESVHEPGSEPVVRKFVVRP